LEDFPFKTSIDGGPEATAKYYFGPEGDYLELVSPPFGGLGRADFREDAIGIVRGGNWYSGHSHTTGIFAVDTIIQDDEKLEIGFRCVFEPI